MCQITLKSTNKHNSSGSDQSRWTDAQTHTRTQYTAVQRTRQEMFRIYYDCRHHANNSFSLFRKRNSFCWKNRISFITIQLLLFSYMSHFGFVYISFIWSNLHARCSTLSRQKSSYFFIIKCVFGKWFQLLSFGKELNHTIDLNSNLEGYEIGLNVKYDFCCAQGLMFSRVVLKRFKGLSGGKAKEILLWEITPTLQNSFYPYEINTQKLCQSEFSLAQ